MASLSQLVIHDGGASCAITSSALAAWGNKDNTYVFGTHADASGLPVYLPLPSGRTVKSATLGGYQTMIIYDNGSVQAVGGNGFYKLGINETSGLVSTLTDVPLPSGKLAKKAVFLGSGTLVLCTDGTILFAGRDAPAFVNPAQQYAFYNTFTATTTFAGKNIVDITGTTNDSVGIIDSDGKAYFIGEWGAFNSSTLVEKTLPAGKIAKNIWSATRQATQSRAYVTCTDGSLYMIGLSGGYSYGIISYGHNFTQLTAIELPAGQTAQFIGVAGEFTMMVTVQGNVYALGRNDWGQLGLNHYSATTEWEQVTTLAAGKTPIAVQCGGSHSILIYNDGTIQCAGRNAHGSLGVSATTVSNRSTFADINTINGAAVMSITTLVAEAGAGGGGGGAGGGAVAPNNTTVDASYNVTIGDHHAPVVVNLRALVDASASVAVFGPSAETISNVVWCTNTLDVSALYVDSEHSLLEFWEPADARGTLKAQIASTRDAQARAQHFAVSLASVIQGEMDASAANPFQAYASRSYDKYTSFGELALAYAAEGMFGHPSATAAITNDVEIVDGFNSDGSKNTAITSAVAPAQGNQALAQRLAAALHASSEAVATAIAQVVLGQDASRATNEDNSERLVDQKAALRFYAGDVVYVAIKLTSFRAAIGAAIGTISQNYNTEIPTPADETYYLRITLA